MIGCWVAVNSPQPLFFSPQKNQRWASTSCEKMWTMWFASRSLSTLRCMQYERSCTIAENWKDTFFFIISGTVSLLEAFGATTCSEASHMHYCDHSHHWKERAVAKPLKSRLEIQNGHPTWKKMIFQAPRSLDSWLVCSLLSSCL